MSEHKKKLLELIEKHGDSLYSLLFRLTLSAQTSEDLLQDVFFKLLNSGSIDNVKNLYFYARRTATNLAFDRHRRVKRTRFNDESAEQTASDIGKPLDEIIKREEHRLVLEAISKLKNPYRDIIVLRYIEQQSYELIAEQTGKTTHQIRAVCSKGIKKLRGILDSNSISREGRIKDV